MRVTGPQYGLPPSHGEGLPPTHPDSYSADTDGPHWSENQSGPQEYTFDGTYASDHTTYDQLQYQQPPYPQQYQPYQQPPPYQPPAPVYQPPVPVAVPAPSGGSGIGRGWLIGGIAAVVVLALVIVGVIVGVGKSNKDGGGNAPAAEAVPFQSVDDLCAKVDAAPLAEWAGKPRDGGEHRTNPHPDSTLMACSVQLLGGSKDGTAGLTFTAEVFTTSAKARDNFDVSRKVATEGKQGGTTVGDLSGLGQQGFTTTTKTDGAGYKSERYTLKFLDGNLVLEMVVALTRDPLPADADLAARAQQVAGTIRDRLRK